MDTGIGRGMLEIASGLMAIALLALLLNKSDSTVKVISSVSTNFDTLLRTVTLNSSQGVGRAG